MKISMLVAIAILTSGCAATLTNDGRMVRQLFNEDGRTDCQFLGIEIVKVPTSTFCFNEEFLRNAVASGGANAFVMSNQRHLFGGGFEVMYEAYNCQQESNFVNAT